MADIKSNPAKVRARIAMDIAKLKATIAQQQYEIMDIEDRKQNNLTNIAQTELAIEDLEAKLSEVAD